MKNLKNTLGRNPKKAKLGDVQNENKQISGMITGIKCQLTVQGGLKDASEEGREDERRYGVLFA